MVKIIKKSKRIVNTKLKMLVTSVVEGVDITQENIRAETDTYFM